jgi:hypothetical protein
MLGPIQAILRWATVVLALAAPAWFLSRTSWHELAKALFALAALYILTAAVVVPLYARPSLSVRKVLRQVPGWVPAAIIMFAVTFGILLLLIGRAIPILASAAVFTTAILFYTTLDTDKRLGRRSRPGEFLEGLTGILFLLLPAALITAWVYEPIEEQWPYWLVFAIIPFIAAGLIDLLTKLVFYVYGREWRRTTWLLGALFFVLLLALPELLTPRLSGPYKDLALVKWSIWIFLGVRVLQFIIVTAIVTLVPAVMSRRRAARHPVGEAAVTLVGAIFCQESHGLWAPVDPALGVHPETVRKLDDHFRQGASNPAPQKFEGLVLRRQVARELEYVAWVLDRHLHRQVPMDRPFADEYMKRQIKAIPAAVRKWEAGILVDKPATADYYLNCMADGLEAILAYEWHRFDRFQQEAVAPSRDSKLRQALTSARTLLVPILLLSLAAFLYARGLVSEVTVGSVVTFALSLTAVQVLSWLDPKAGSNIEIASKLISTWPGSRRAD